MSKAIRIHATGGPEVLQWVDVDVPAPGAGEVLIRHTAVGLNFIDVYMRSGLYPQRLPAGLGSEAAGVIEALGPKVKGFKAGDRVVYMLTAQADAYSERRVLPAAALVKIPSGVSDEQAAAVWLKGLTCWYLLRQTWRVKRGETLLLPAAAGGVGLVLSQWARALGARVIGVVSSADKATLARRHGCHTVLVGYEGMAAQVRKLTKGRGVDVVYDGVGQQTFFASLDCLRPRGLMVSFGNASGPVAPFSPLELSKRGSLYVTRTTMADYVGDPVVRARAARELFALVRARKLRIVIGQRYPLAEAASAQADLEARRTSGASILVP